MGPTSFSGSNCQRNISFQVYQEKNYKKIIIIYQHTHTQASFYLKYKLFLQVDGTILAPTSSSAWGSSGVGQWIEFTQLLGFTIKGKGAFDGRGSVWWTNRQVAKTKPMVRTK